MFSIGWLFCITFNENFWFCKKYFLTFSELNQRGGKEVTHKKPRTYQKYMESSSRKKDKKDMYVTHAYFPFFRVFLVVGWD